MNAKEGFPIVLIIKKFKIGAFMLALLIWQYSFVPSSYAQQPQDMAEAKRIKELIAEGDNFKAKRDYTQALDSYKKAYDIAEKLNDCISQAQASLNSGHIHFAQGNYVLALDNYHKSLTRYEEVKDKSGIASALNNIGNVYFAQGNYGEALKHLQNGLQLREELNDTFGISNSLSNLGNYYISQGDYEQALKYHQNSLKLRESLQDPTWIAVSANNIGNIYWWQGNYAKALEYYNKSLILRRKSNNTGGIVYALHNIGNAYWSQGNYDLAFKYLQESLKPIEEMGDKKSLAITLNNIGNIYKSQGNFSSALEHYTKSLKLSEETESKADTARTLINIGNIHMDQANYKLALEYYAKSMSIIGNVHEKQGDYKQSLEFAERATDTAKKIGNRQILWEAQALLGKIHRSLKQFDKSRQTLEEAVNTIEIMRSEVGGSEQDQQRFFENKLSPYHELIQLLISQQNGNEAFHYAERAKARVLSDVLQKGRINISKAMTPEEKEQEQRLYSEIVSLNNQIHKQTLNTKSIEEIKSRLDKARLEYKSFQATLYVAHPELRLQRGEARTINVEDISVLLPNKKTALLEFVVTEDQTILFVFTNGSSAQKPFDLKIYPINIKRKELVDRISDFRQRLASVNLLFRKPSSELYQLLLKPAEAQLKDKNSLIMVPDGILWELPFQALLNEHNRYLLEDHAISYVPSLTVLKEMIKQKQNKPSSFSLLAFGNPDLGRKQSNTSDQLLMDDKLNSLPEAEKQVKMLAELYGSTQSKIYLGAEATETKAKTEAPKYRILHFATHGILNDISPLYSHVVLSQTEKNETEDGLFEAWELMRLELNAELVVLSACETARGRFGAGEGVIGLTWALFVAGSPTTVVSQWKVESASTTNLMVDFHKELKETLDGKKITTKAEALRQAALKLLRSEQYRHPFYWASFVIVGEAT
jgi:CHAT domain-containing protein/Flp pilus assembly protein TadD